MQGVRDTPLLRRDVVSAIHQILLPRSVLQSWLLCGPLEPSRMSEKPASLSVSGVFVAICADRAESILCLERMFSRGESQFLLGEEGSRDGSGVQLEQRFPLSPEELPHATLCL